MRERMVPEVNRCLSKVRVHYPAWPVVAPGPRQSATRSPRRHMSCGRRGFFDIDLLARSTLPCEALNESKRVLGLVDSRASWLSDQTSRSPCPPTWGGRCNREPSRERSFAGASYRVAGVQIPCSYLLRLRGPSGVPTSSVHVLQRRGGRLRALREMRKC